MSNSHSRQARGYIEHVQDFLRNVEIWLGSLHLSSRKASIELNEEKVGRYDAPGLALFDQHNNKIADIIPVGASIIGAEGRIDIAGPLDREIVVYLKGQGPDAHYHVKENDPAYGANQRPMFSGVAEDGWYWIENPHFRKARPVDRELFENLLHEVSDYEP